MSQSSFKPSKTAADKNAYAGLWALVLFAAAVGFYASLLVGWIVFPRFLYSKQNQPIDFNHVVHVASADDSCQSCHSFRQDGSFAGMPALSQCASCHEGPDSLQGENPEEKKFVDEYVVKEKEVPWLIYSRQPDCVFFSHAAHVFSPKMRQFRDKAYKLPADEVEEGAYDDTTCHVCHGFIGESEHNRPYEQNRITGYSRDIWGENIAGIKKHTWDRMKMDDCAECHEKVKGYKEACFVCHK